MQNLEFTGTEIISLDGDWAFTYTQSIGEYENPKVPDVKEFVARMPVPGYWDDNTERMQAFDFWASEAKFNPAYRHIDFPMGDFIPPDASLPYLEGVGWYRKTILVPSEWKDKTVSLKIGGVLLEAWVLVNGKLAKYHLGHSTPFEISLGENLKFGEVNEIIIAVANTRDDRLGCVIRGFKGFSAGIYRSVSIKVSGKAAIRDLYIYPDSGLQALNWNVRLRGNLENNTLIWRIRDIENQKVIKKDTLPVNAENLKWKTEAFGLQPWSDNSPKLYNIELSIVNGGEIIDSHCQTFGLRLLAREDTALKLNGRPVFLRGGTEHAYFPLTCTPPSDLETYRSNIKKMKEIGFNWLRFHTWVPSEEYMNAADQLGIMIQVEAPVGFGEAEWLDILHTCRKHPSVVIYCCGNEELLDEAKIDQLRIMAELCHTNVPDALFNPQEAMRGIEYYWSNPGEDECREDYPFRHNPKRLDAVREFSDVFGQYPLGLLSYFSITGDWRVLNERLEIYKRPCLSHELNITGNYLNLDLEHRYEGTRIGTDMFAAVRRYMKKEGVLSKSAVYYRHSCYWAAIMRKHAIEMARKCRYIAGYDYLGPIDYHWHRIGYPCGIMNEFYELKPGDSIKNVLRFNGESVLLLDHTNNRNMYSGDTLELDLFSSLYGEGPLEEGCVSYYVADDKHHIFQRGEIGVKNIKNGAIEKLITIPLKGPDTDRASKLTLYTRLSGGEYEIENQWDYWVFPKPSGTDAAVYAESGIAEEFYQITGNTSQCDNDAVKIVSELTEETLNFVENGGKAILLGTKPFASLPTSFQLSLAGRIQGNLATIIEDHPLMNRFPHEGFFDWQFYTMFNEGHAVLFNELNIPFKPIIEVVSSFKLIRKQSNLFEIAIGGGKLLICTLNLTNRDPAATYMLKTMIEYANSEDFNPENMVSADVIRKLLEEDRQVSYNFATDAAFDPNANKNRNKSR